MRAKLSEKLKSEKISLVAIACLVCFIHIIRIGQVYYPYIVDEFGYWGAAAFMAGHDWSEVMGNIPYYSFGYSFLLVPLMKLIENPVVIYKIQIILNGLFMSASFGIAYTVGKKLFKETDKKFLMLTAFLVTVYTGHVTLSSTGLTECLLILLGWTSVWLVIKIYERDSIKDILLLIVVSVYAYTVHQRMLSMLAAAAVIILLKLARNISWKKIGLVFGCILVVLLLSVLLKTVVKGNVWGNTESNITDINDYSVQIMKLKAMLDVRVFADTVKEFMGQFFYAGAATFMLIYVGLISLFGKAYSFIKRKNKDGIYIFILLYFFGLLAISTVYYSINIGRIDQYIYGRYLEPAYGPVLFAGCIALYNVGKKAIWYTGIIPVAGLFAYVTDKRIYASGFSDFSIGSASALAMLYTEYNLSMKKIALITCFVFILILALCSIKRKIFSYICTALISCWFIGVGWHENQLYVVERQEIYNNSRTVIDTIKQLNEELPIYCVRSIDSGYVRWMNFIQFMFPEKTVKVIDYNQLTDSPEEKYVILPTRHDLYYRGGMGSEYSLLDITTKYMLFVSEGETKTAFIEAGGEILDDGEEIEIPLTLFHSRKSDRDKDTGNIRSKGEKSRILYGLTQKAAVKQYHINTQFKLISSKSEKAGTLSILDQNKQVRVEKELYKSDFTDGKLTVELMPEFKTEGEKMQIQVEAEEGSILEVESVSIR